MKFIAIAKIADGKKVIGYRLLNKQTGEVRDVENRDIKAYLQYQSVGTIENLYIQSGRIVGNNKILQRLPYIIDNKLIKNPNLIMIDQTDFTKYLVTDYNGQIVEMDITELTEYAKRHKIANGVLVKGKDNSIYIYYDNYKAICEYEHLMVKRINCKLQVLEAPYRLENDRSITVLDGELTSANIMDYVLYIKDSTFEYCTKLKQITLPKGLLLIGRKAFHGCVRLEQIDIPDSVTEIKSCAFTDCHSIKRIDIPAKVRIIQEASFYDCIALRCVKLPNSIELIEEKAFTGCVSLKTIEIPDKVTEIRANTFSRCVSLEQIRLPRALEKIGTRAFMECDALKEIDIPPNVKYIEYGAFHNCISLERIKLSEGFKDAGRSLFVGCNALKEVYAPKGANLINADIPSHAKVIRY